VYKTVLILAPHTDDGELGCGGTIARFVEEGRDVHLVAFSDASDSLDKKRWPKDDQLRQELHAAAKVLGLAEDHVRVLDHRVRHFPAQRQEILEEIIELRKTIQPDLVFVPSPNDIHQDHQVIAHEGLRAFKKQTILGYEEPWNNIVFETRCFVPLTEAQVEKKVEALRCYKTQLERSYLDEVSIRALVRTRGTQLESKYAEAFEVLRMVMP
jgi:N-acetylglucosamine malate deacetylase 1